VQQKRTVIDIGKSRQEPGPVARRWQCLGGMRKYTCEQHIAQRNSVDPATLAQEARASCTTCAGRGRPPPGRSAAPTRGNRKPTPKNGSVQAGEAADSCATPRALNCRGRANNTKHPARSRHEADDYRPTQKQTLGRVAPRSSRPRLHRGACEPVSITSFPARTNSPRPRKSGRASPPGRTVPHKDARSQTGGHAAAVV